MQSELKTIADNNRELWLGMPKGGRTLGASDAEFLTKAGIAIAEKISRVDDYILTDTMSGLSTPMGVRVFDMKPQMALSLLSQNKLNCAVVGRDVLKEFNYASRGQKNIMQAVELLDMDMSNCALTLAVRENDTATTAQDLNGRVVVTKYPNIVAGWARANKIEFERIISGINGENDITGGIEGFAMFEPSVTVIVDMVESGESLVRYGWKPLGAKEQDWDPVRMDVLNDVGKSKRRRFIDTDSKKLEDIEGVLMLSSAVLVRNSKKLSEKQEDALDKITNRFYNASEKLGAKPTLKNKAVRRQNEDSRRLKYGCVRTSTGRMTSHGLAFI